ALAVQKLKLNGELTGDPLRTPVASVSCGIYQDTAILDLNYEEDFGAAVDMNFVMDGEGKLVEVQGTAEERTFTVEELGEMLSLAKKGIGELLALQQKILG
ncbi:ribonuclease PH, partial [Myxococcota bacterium]|nr:ribonuclease PH [Myxococcota bacterium]